MFFLSNKKAAPVPGCRFRYFSVQSFSFSYRTYVIVLTLFSFLMSNLGLNALIAVSVPVLTMLYPLAIVLVALSFFRRFYL